jgi:phenylacetate-CoA ligase
VHLFHQEDGRDVMLIKVEKTGEEAPDVDKLLAESIIAEIRKQIMVRAQVEVLPHGALPRTERKSKRVFDHRVLEY